MVEDVSDFSDSCIVCGQQIPAEGCEVEQCAQYTCPKCENTDGACEDPECPSVKSHEEGSYECPVCGKTAKYGEPCERADCPRVAAAKIRKASVDTPFKLGL